MDLEESIDLYSIRTLMNLSRYMLSQKPILKRVLTQLDVQMQELAEEVAAEENIKKFNVYSDKQRAFFFYYFNRIKLWKAATTAEWQE